MIPALLIITSTKPISCFIFCAVSSICIGFETSTEKPEISPSFLNSAIVLSIPVWLMSQMITFAFRSKHKRTIILPIPEAPPVIKTVLFVSCIFVDIINRFTLDELFFFKIFYFKLFKSILNNSAAFCQRINSFLSSGKSNCFINCKYDFILEIGQSVP